jgi:hypothetical protein
MVRCRKCKAEFIAESVTQEAPLLVPDSEQPDEHVNQGRASPKPKALCQNRPDALPPVPSRTNPFTSPWVIGMAAFCVLDAGILVGVLVKRKAADTPALLDTPPTTPAATPKFNPSDAQETARWAGEILKPLNSIPEGINEIARNDALQAEMVKIKADTGVLIEQAVSWEMDCGVSEEVVTLFPHKYSQDGNPHFGSVERLSDKSAQCTQLALKRADTIIDLQQKRAFLVEQMKKAKKDVESARYAMLKNQKNAADSGNALDPVLMVLDDRPKMDQYGLPNWEEHPDLRFFQIDVPEKISRAEAAKLTERVVVNAKIKEVEIGWYKSLKHNERFLLYFYLTDVKLKPVER